MTHAYLDSPGVSIRIPLHAQVPILHLGNINDPTIECLTTNEIRRYVAETLRNTFEWNMDGNKKIGIFEAYLESHWPSENERKAVYWKHRTLSKEILSPWHRIARQLDSRWQSQQISRKPSQSPYEVKDFWPLEYWLERFHRCHCCSWCHPLRHRNWSKSPWTMSTLWIMLWATNILKISRIMSIEWVGMLV